MSDTYSINSNGFSNLESPISLSSVGSEGISEFNFISLNKLKLINPPEKRLIDKLDIRKMILFGGEKLLNLFFVGFIIGKTLDCLAPIYQTEKLFVRRFGGDKYPELMHYLIYSFIASDVFISNGALFLAKGKNRYAEKLIKLFKLIKGEKDIVLDLDKLSVYAALERRPMAIFFSKDLSNYLKENNIDYSDKSSIRNFISNWLLEKSNRDKNYFTKDVNTNDFIDKLTDSVLKQIDTPYKYRRMLFAAFNLSVYTMYIWLKWDSLKGGVSHFVGGRVPEKVIDIVCLCCLGASCFYDLEPYLKNGDGIISDVLKIPNSDLFYNYQDERAIFWFKFFSRVSIISSFLYFIVVEHDFAKEKLALKVLKAVAALYVNICTKIYSLWPWLKGRYSNNKLVIYQFGEQPKVKLDSLIFKLILGGLFFLALLRTLSKSGLSTLETSFEGSLFLLDLVPGVNIKLTQENFYLTLLIGVPFATVNMLINWTWKTGPVIGKVAENLKDFELYLIEKFSNKYKDNRFCKCLNFFDNNLLNNNRPGSSDSDSSSSDDFDLENQNLSAKFKISDADSDAVFVL